MDKVTNEDVFALCELTKVLHTFKPMAKCKSNQERFEYHTNCCDLDLGFETMPRMS